MTAAELASFRSLLQAQAPPRPDSGLFARMRARLTVVERSEPADDVPPRARAPVVPPRLVAATWDEAEVRVADPPPGVPPVFGRREAGAEVEPPRPPAPAAAPAREQAPVRLRPRVCVEEAHATPDEPPAERSRTPSARPPGTIAGWSRARPPSAQRRILQRLDAVFTAELRGLEARIAADAPMR